ncbi:MAG: metalloregulator ArsR/SmtB family transcription factor [Deltaproteobacteria bacterium]|nr:metalloregulator ArsR/SmtB family transcription factor [Deltaproteobacteria bacterium]
MQGLAETFKALSDETRLKILKLLENDELCVCDIVAALDMVQPQVSFHLNVLKGAGLVKDKKNGKWIYYRLDGADMFKRFLILSINERVSETSIANCQKRLESFLKKRGAKQADYSREKTGC